MKYNYQLEAMEKLQPAGFKKQREFFFLLREPNIMVLYRKFEAKGNDVYYLAFTHTFLGNVKNKDGKYLIPTFLEYYPISLTTDELRYQFSRFASIREFDCDFHHLSREKSPAPPVSNTFDLSVKSFLKNIFTTGKTADKTGNPVDIILQEGMLFFEQFSPEFTLQQLKKYTGSSNSIIHEQLAQCEKYVAEHP